MPELCRFDGITVLMHTNEHNPPHFHAEYAEYDVWVSLDPIEIVHGRFPARKRRQLLAWAERRTPELRKAWDSARNGQPLERIEP